MIKKIQKYLLVHCPMLWNIRIVPVLLIIIGLNALFFGMQYFITDTGFQQRYYYFHYQWIVFFSILTGGILLIGWLYFYSGNNALKSFYPRTTIQLYAEWFLIFVIVTGAILLPFSVKKGYDAKWKSMASLEETKAANRLLERVEMLIPSDLDDYKFTKCDSVIPGCDSLGSGLLVRDSACWSLLFFKNYYCNDDYFEHDPEYRSTDSENIITVKTWLVEGRADSIYALMTEFNRLQQKHQLEETLTPEQWFEYVYHPPFFPVDTIIKKYDYHDDIKYNYLPYDNLKNGYKELTSVYNNARDNEYFLLTTLCFSLCISLLVFSFRVTNVKSWVFALIAAAGLVFLNILVAIPLIESSANEETIISFILFLWLILFGVLLVRVLSKIRNRSNKGKSLIYMNILLWLVPCVIPFLFFAYYFFRYDSRYMGYFDLDEYIPLMFWINLVVVVPAMWLVALLVRKWKSIADE